MEFDKTKWSCPWNNDQNCTQNSAGVGGGWGSGGGGYGLGVMGWGFLVPFDRPVAKTLMLHYFHRPSLYKILILSKDIITDSTCHNCSYCSMTYVCRSFTNVANLRWKSECSLLNKRSKSQFASRC